VPFRLGHRGRPEAPRSGTATGHRRVDGIRHRAWFRHREATRDRLVEGPAAGPLTLRGRPPGAHWNSTPPLRSRGRDQRSNRSRSRGQPRGRERARDRRRRRGRGRGRKGSRSRCRSRTRARGRTRGQGRTRGRSRSTPGAPPSAPRVPSRVHPARARAGRTRALSPTTEQGFAENDERGDPTDDQRHADGGHPCRHGGCNEWGIGCETS